MDQLTVGNEPWYNLPPPYDRYPFFPIIFFGEGGEPHLGWQANSALDSGTLKGVDDLTVCQIVPSSGNPYVQWFGGKGYRRWDSPDTGGKGVYNQWIHCDLIVIF